MDPDAANLTVSIIFLLLGGLVVFLQNVIINIPDSIMKSDDGEKIPKGVAEFLNRSREFSSTMRTAYTFFHLAFALTFYGYICSLAPVAKFMAKGMWQSTLTSILLVLVMCFMILVLSRGIPKRLATVINPHTSLKLISLAKLSVIIFTPLRFISDMAVAGFSALFDAQYKEGEDNITEQEIRMMVDVSQETGGIEQTEKDMINNIFEFDDRTASDIMTHRTNVIFIEKDMTLKEIIGLVQENGYSRLPVIDDGVDDVIGMLYVKDLLAIILDETKVKNFKVTDYMRETIFIPESTRCHDLFTQLNSAKTQVAIVIDEYGGTSGMVTMEDILESIVGDISDEYDSEETDVTELPEDNCYSLEGDIELLDVERLLDCDLSEYIDEDYETLGGLIIGLLDRIPKPDEHPVVTVANIKCTVLSANNKQILKIKAEKLAEAEPDECDLSALEDD